MQTDSVRHTISIEQFAAFLDGNLPEADLQAVAAAIDADPELTSVLGDILQVDEASEPLDGMPAAVPDELLTDEAGFCLPEIPEAAPDDVAWVTDQPATPVLQPVEPAGAYPWVEASHATTDEVPPEVTPEVPVQPTPAANLPEGMPTDTGWETADAQDCGGEFE
ncbi:hypothetical protein MR642_00815 [bacterium]|nr:hypothetical protein [bacterium]